MIKVSNIHKRFGELEVLRGVSLEVKKGEIVLVYEIKKPDHRYWGRIEDGWICLQFAEKVE